MKRELVVAYRIYPGLSKSPAFFHSKDDLARVALATFGDALDDVDYVMHAILDDCPDEYVGMFSDIFAADRLKIERHTPKIGNTGTWMRQLEILCSQKDANVVLLAEDDYLWRPGCIRAHVDLHRECQIVDFSTPYDHPGYYYGPSVFPFDRHGVLVHGAKHWRTAACNTLTFFANRNTLIQTRSTFESFARGSHDMSLWIALTKYFVHSPVFMLRALRDPFTRSILLQAWRHNFAQSLWGRKYNLWSPVPALATHLEGVCLAPGVDWELLVRRHIRHP